MAARAGTGMRLNLDQVPQRAADLSAYEMMLSESQERMMVVVQAGREQPFLDVFKKWGLTAVPCGEVLKDRRLVVLHHGEQVANLPNVMLGDGAPDYDRPLEEPAPYASRQRLSDADIAAALGRIAACPLPSVAAAPAPASVYEDLLRRLLAHPGIASKEWVYRQYDYMVRTNTLAGPGLTDAAVLRIKETGQGLALATDGPARHVLLDPALGGARAVLESARNVLACGAQPLGITNCLNFGSPEKPGRMWQFVRCIDGMRAALGELELPVTGGNVSFYNETGGRPVLPTPVIGMLGLLDRAERYVPNRVLQPGLELYLLGPVDGRLDGSALIFDLGRLRAGELAEHDYTGFRACARFLVKAAQESALTACHDVSDGGLLTAVVEMCALGAEIELPGPLPDLYDVEEHNRLGALFGEEGHRWIIAVTPAQRSWVRTAALHYSIKLLPLGRTASGTLSVSMDGEPWFAAPWEPLAQCHAQGLSMCMEQP
jgi:phosphoribosylformylglycinamidine synthase